VLQLLTYFSNFFGGFSVNFSFVPEAHAMAQQAGGNAQGGGMSFLITMTLIGFVFYFLLIRPQSKQAKSHQQLLDGLKRDDMVVTTGGIHGKITNVAEAVVTVEIAPNIRIKVTKKNIAGLSNINKQQDEKNK
jgi:preprotein translocase subunit YajC